MTMSMIDVPAEDSAAGASRREFIDDDLLEASQVLFRFLCGC